MDYDYGAHVFDASYTWDTEGRMTRIKSAISVCGFPADRNAGS